MQRMMLSPLTEGLGSRQVIFVVALSCLEVIARIVHERPKCVKGRIGRTTSESVY